jgi:serine O-acetyltransferase
VDVLRFIKYGKDQLKEKWSQIGSKRQWFVANEQIWEFDPIWASIRREALRMAIKCPVLASSLHATILNHKRLENALAYKLCNKIESALITATQWYNVILEAFESNDQLGVSIRADLEQIYKKDPACIGYSHPLLYLKGFHGVTLYRVANHLLNTG